MSRTFYGNGGGGGGGGGGLTEIETVTLAAAGTIAFSAIPQTYRALEVRGMVRASAALAGATVECTFNGSAAGYSHNSLEVADATVQGAATNNVGSCRIWNVVVGSDATGLTAADLQALFSPVTITLPEYASTTKFKAGTATYTTRREAAPSTINRHGMTGWQWRNTAAITSIGIVQQLAAGSTLTLYGSA